LINLTQESFIYDADTKQHEAVSTDAVNVYTDAHTHAVSAAHALLLANYKRTT